VRILYLSKGYVGEGDSLYRLHRLPELLLRKPGGVIAGVNLFPILAQLVPQMRGDSGWSATLRLQKKRKIDTERVGGIIYFTHLTYRHPKVSTHVRGAIKRYRPGSIKWIVLNLELFAEVDEHETREAANSLLQLATARGVSPRTSPAAYGGAMLRSSVYWGRDRRPAPRFISEAARTRLPGNYYALREGYQIRSIPRAYYLDQRSSHHSIAGSIALPSPMHLRARGLFRGVEAGRTSPWARDIGLLHGHTGLLIAVIECDLIPRSQLHLYPAWARQRGRRVVWIWTPELRLLDRRIRLMYVSAALTSPIPDPVLTEYAQWSLAQLRKGYHPIVKPTLLAGYGLLAVRSGIDIERYSITGQRRSERATVSQLPLVGPCYRTEVKNDRTPTVQNVVARGVLEAETRTRSIEYARELESQGIPVSQIYADGLIAVTDSMPFLREGWRMAGELTNVRSPSGNSIVADEFVRLPGIPNGRRTARIERLKSEPDYADKTV